VGRDQDEAGGSDQQDVRQDGAHLHRIDTELGARRVEEPVADGKCVVVVLRDVVAGERTPTGDVAEERRDLLPCIVVDEHSRAAVGQMLLDEILVDEHEDPDHGEPAHHVDDGAEPPVLAEPIEHRTQAHDGGCCGVHGPITSTSVKRKRPGVRRPIFT
jgi:hypothetical protein